MLDYIWAAMLLLSVAVGLTGGRAAELTTAAFSGAGAAISLLITLTAGVVLWSGIMRLAQQSGVTRLISRLLRPLIRLVFNTAPDGAAAQAICMNIAANMLGLGNAATPFGLEAMRALALENPDPDSASDDMASFVIINTASVQLIPTTVIMLRLQHGAENPSDLLLPVWICSVSCLAIGLCAAAVFARLGRRRR